MLHKVLNSFLFLGFLRMSRFALLTGLQDVSVSQKQMDSTLLMRGGGTQGDVMSAALNNRNGGNQSQLGITLQVGDVDNTDVAHGGLDLVRSLYNKSIALATEEFVFLEHKRFYFKCNHFLILQFLY